MSNDNLHEAAVEYVARQNRTRHPQGKTVRELRAER